MIPGGIQLEIHYPALGLTDVDLTFYNLFDHGCLAVPWAYLYPGTIQPRHNAHTQNPCPTSATAPRYPRFVAEP